MVCFRSNQRLVIPSSIDLFKVNNISTRKRCEISSKLTIKTDFIVNFEHITHVFLMFVLLTLNKPISAGLDIALIFFMIRSIFLKRPFNIVQHVFAFQKSGAKPSL